MDIPSGPTGTFTDFSHTEFSGSSPRSPESPVSFEHFFEHFFERSEDQERFPRQSHGPARPALRFDQKAPVA